MGHFRKRERTRELGVRAMIQLEADLQAGRNGLGYTGTSEKARLAGGSKYVVAC